MPVSAKRREAAAAAAGWDGLISDGTETATADRSQSRQSIQSAAQAIKSKLSKGQNSTDSSLENIAETISGFLPSSSQGSLFEGINLLTKEVSFLRGKLAAVFGVLVFMFLMVEFLEVFVFQSGHKPKASQIDFQSELELNGGCPLGAICYGPKNSAGGTNTIPSSSSSNMISIDQTNSMTTGFSSLSTFQPGGFQPSGFQPSGFQPSGFQPGGFQPGGSSSSQDMPMLRGQIQPVNPAPALSFVPNPVPVKAVAPRVVVKKVVKPVKKPVPSKSSSKDSEMLKKLARERELLLKEKELMERQRDKAQRDKRKVEAEMKSQSKLVFRTARQEKHARDVARAARTGWTPPKKP